MPPQRRVIRRKKKSPLSQTPMSEEDYIDEDPVIPGQEFAAVSMALPPKDQVELAVSHIAQEMDVNSDIVDGIVQQWESIMCDRRAFKIRGVYATQDQIEKRAQQIKRFDRIHHIYTTPVGKWVPFGVPPEKAEDVVYQQDELNSLMKGLYDQKEKATEHYEERRRDMMEQALKKNKEKKKLEEKANADDSVDAILNRLDAQTCALKYQLDEVNSRMKNLQEEYHSCCVELTDMMKEHPEYQRKEEYKNPEKNPLISMTQ